MKTLVDSVTPESLAAISALEYTPEELVCARGIATELRTLLLCQEQGEPTTQAAYVDLDINNEGVKTLLTMIEALEGGLRMHRLMSAVFSASGIRTVINSGAIPGLDLKTKSEPLEPLVYSIEIMASEVMNRYAAEIIHGLVPYKHCGPQIQAALLRALDDQEIGPRPEWFQGPVAVDPTQQERELAERLNMGGDFTPEDFEAPEIAHTGTVGTNSPEFERALEDLPSLADLAPEPAIVAELPTKGRSFGTLSCTGPNGEQIASDGTVIPDPSIFDKTYHGEMPAPAERTQPVGTFDAAGVVYDTDRARDGANGAQRPDGVYDTDYQRDGK